MDPQLIWPELVGRFKFDIESNVVNKTPLINVAVEGGTLHPLQASAYESGQTFDHFQTIPNLLSFFACPDTKSIQSFQQSRAQLQALMSV